MADLLCIEGLHFAFREGDRTRHVLHGAGATVQAGEWVALLGRSGSGKSTLLNLVAGIDTPAAGTVTICGTDVHGMSDRDRTVFRRRAIGFVFQSFHLLPTLTVLENVLLPLDLDGRPSSEKTARARALLERVGLADRAGSWPDRLSGGEQQRVALARALVAGPRLLLADEPTGNLDEDSAEVVLAALAELAREEDAAILMATHSRRAADRADRVLHLHEGRIEGS